MITWSTAITALVLFLGGHAVMAVFRPARPRSRLERHGTALLLGLSVVPALVTGLVLAIGPLGPGLTRGLASVLAAGGLLALVRSRAASETWDPGSPEPWTLAERLGAILIVLFSCFVVFYTATMPMHIFDPVYHFAYKGKLLYHEGLMTSSWMDVEAAIGRVITHPDYPPGVGALEAFHGWIGGAFDEDGARPLFALFALAPAALLFGALWDMGRRANRRASITGALMWLALPFLFYSRLPHKDWGKGAYGLIFGPQAGEARFGRGMGPNGPLTGEWPMPDGWTLDGAGDLPLAALFFGGFVAFLRYLTGPREQRDPSDLLIAGVLFGGGALMKNEGLALLVVMALAFGVTWLVRHFRGAVRAGIPGPIAIGLVLVVALIIASPWLAVRGDMPTIGEDYPSRLSASGIIESWNSSQPVHAARMDGEAGEMRVPKIVASGFWEAFTHVPRFGFLWILFGAAVLWGLLRPRRWLDTPAFPAALAVLGASALYAIVLLVTPWNLDDLFTTAIPDRLILHVAPLAILSMLLIFDHEEEESFAADTDAEREAP